MAAGQVATGPGRRWRRRDTPDHGPLRRHQPHLPAGSPAPQIMAAVRNLAIGVLAEQDRSMPSRSGSTAATPHRPSDQARIKWTTRKNARALPRCHRRRATTLQQHERIPQYAG